MIEVVVVSRTDEAKDICTFELASVEGRPLPVFSAGAHIDVHLPNGIIRQYSLCNPPHERHRYQIGVLKSPDSRGGSTCMHEEVQCGDRLHISEPRNLFELTQQANRTLLFAGGIGITPILCMAERLEQTQANFELHYCSRSKERAAFLDRLEHSAFCDRVNFHFDEEPATQLQAEALLAHPEPGSHLYVCGPTGFMEHILGTAKALGWPPNALHREYFSASPVNTSQDDAFTIKVASTGQLLEVTSDQSVVQVLHQHGFDIPIACEQGVCGTCLTRVLEGTPEHRDMFLTEDEQACNDQFTPCCSRSKTAVLVLDI
ncbi:PDR/VanB family oxidoreductase [Pseudomonas sp. R5(2019)]|uniref:PDR/VanB family oxidoreductase n=1 Tax=Pseudomonas sp. R5(2019) TaxID=2697566 RepID=UPI001412862C|nr:PDR/VanB family oxidoreductase [Pseudomonas sp. R5(2019)]NBA96008.1 2Fe-2S iron-sulfur cluster binding domain-containing protein [Pseudomonas sp. R5(2019)]